MEIVIYFEENYFCSLKIAQLCHDNKLEINKEQLVIRITSYNPQKFLCYTVHGVK